MGHKVLKLSECVMREFIWRVVLFSQITYSGASAPRGAWGSKFQLPRTFWRRLVENTFDNIRRRKIAQNIRNAILELER